MKLWSYLGRNLGASRAGPVAVHPHPIFSQEFLKIHVLELKQPSVTRQGPLPQQRTQEGGLGVGSQWARARGSSHPSGPSSIDTQRVFIGVQGLVFVWRGGKVRRLTLCCLKQLCFDTNRGCFMTFALLKDGNETHSLSLLRRVCQRTKGKIKYAH